MNTSIKKNIRIDLSGATVILCATILLIIFYGEPDLHDALIASLTCENP